MKVDMVMPQMGESIAEATISKWLKNPGDAVQKDEIILEISTDKVDSEIPSPASGTLVEVLYSQGDVVPVKTKIATIDTAAGASASAPSAKPAAAQPSAAPVSAAPAGGGLATVESEPRIEHPPADVNGKHDSGRYYSPLVRSLAEKHGIPSSVLDTIPGTGQGGRVSKQDLLSFIDRKGGEQAAPVRAAEPQAARAPSPAPAPASSRGSDINWGEGDTTIVTMDNMRQAIAEHMVRSKQTSPHVYSIQEVDMTRVSQWRKANKGKFEQSEGFNLSFTPFFLEAAVRALIKFPYVNSSVEGKKIILKKHVNLGCAVALGNTGLIVPVIKHAEERNLVGLARSLNDLAARARNKKLSPDDVTGGTFTVTNPGIFGTMIGTPIINQPQVAILCLGAIKKRPVVIDDMIAIREICYLTLSYDHRVVDGSLGGQFLAFIREYLESWDTKRSLY